MNEEVEAARQRWIQALESGNYKQTKGKLKDTRGYCCLGVAVEVTGVAELVPDPKWPDQYCVLGEVSNWDAILDPATAKALNISPGGRFDDGFVVAGPRYDAAYLFQLNDLLEWTFPQIASFLRRHFDKIEPYEKSNQGAV